MESGFSSVLPARVDFRRSKRAALGGAVFGPAALAILAKFRMARARNAVWIYHRRYRRLSVNCGACMDKRADAQRRAVNGVGRALDCWQGPRSDTVYPGDSHRECGVSRRYCAGDQHTDVAITQSAQLFLCRAAGALGCADHCVIPRVARRHCTVAKPGPAACAWRGSVHHGGHGGPRDPDVHQQRRSPHQRNTQRLRRKTCPWRGDFVVRS